MNLTEKILAKLDKEIALQKQYLDSSFYVDKKPYEIQLSFLFALRRQVEKHTLHEKCTESCFAEGWCNFCLEGNRYPCTFITEVATDLGIEIEG